MLEYLVERGIIAPPTDEDAAYVTMLCLRRAWINHLLVLANQWRVSMTAVRTIHEYVIGFNWCDVLRELEERLFAPR